MNTRSILSVVSLSLLAAAGVGVQACSTEEASDADDRSSQSALGAPVLGSAKGFAVLGGSTVTNTGPSVITGDLGVSPGLAIVGFPPGIVNGQTHAGDAVALQAQTDVTAAFNALSAEACTADLTGKDLGGMTLTPGVYCFGSSAQLTGALVLDAGGKADAVFIFKTASTLTSASNASVRVINGGSDCGVFWQVGSSATLGTGTVFSGSILALASVTLTTTAKVSGRVYARTGAVTMDTNAVSLPICAVAPPASDAGADAAKPVDSGAPDAKPDAVVTPDAATPVDAGPKPDAGPPADAGTADTGTGPST